MPDVKRLLYAIALISLLLCPSELRAQSTTNKSTVILVRDPAAVSTLTVDTARTRQLVQAGICRLAGTNDLAAAWHQFVATNDVVGLKVNTTSAPLGGTHLAVVDAVASGLRQAGLPATNIIVWDRDPGKLQTAGILPSSNYTVVAITPGGWDKEVFVENKLVGKLIWGDLAFGHEESDLGTRSHLPKLVTKTITKLINIPALQDHDPCGLAGCLYNLSLGSVDNTRRFEQYGQHGDPIIVEVARLPAIREKLVLNIMDALIPGFAGGPAFKPQYSWPFGGIYFSRDPVAIDVLGLEAIEAQRKVANVPAIATAASHISTAGLAGLGETNRANIEVIEVAP